MQARARRNSVGMPAPEHAHRTLSTHCAHTQAEDADAPQQAIATATQVIVFWKTLSVAKALRLWKAEVASCTLPPPGANGRAHGQPHLGAVSSSPLCVVWQRASERLVPGVSERM